MATTVAPGLEVSEAVAAAQAARPQWHDPPRVLREAARVVLARADEIADCIVAETSKPRTEAIAHDLFPAADHALWLAKHAPRILRDERVRIAQPHLRTKKAWLVYEPLGVIGAITPWNIPFGIPFSIVTTALAAGNGAVLKPSERTPLTGEWVRRVFEEAGAPAGLVQVVRGEAEVGEALVGNPDIAKVFFTGSVAVGRRVAAAAGARGCPVVLELGGRDPLIVFADADVERAVEGATFASFANSGQLCVSAERIYVERPLYPEFRRLLEERAKRTAGEVVDGPLDDEEIFGPVVSIEPFDDEDDAVRRANESRFGLSASVWTRDLAKARRVARRLEAGMVWTNDFAHSFAMGQAPWGGVKESGFGRTSGRHGLYECVNVKYADFDRGRIRPAWWFPYDAATERSLRALLDVLYGDRRLAAAWRHRRELVHVAKRSLGR